MRAFLLLVLALLPLSCATYKEKTLAEYKPSKKGVTKDYALKLLRVTIESEPYRTGPELVLKVERLKVRYLYRKVIRRRYKVWDDGKKERLPGKAKTRVETIANATPQWVPWKGLEIKIRVDGSDKVFSVTTDEQGRATFDVSPFSDAWIEGRELQVRYHTRIPAYPSAPADLWDKVKAKRTSMPELMKLLGKFEVKAEEGTVTVPARVLEGIHERLR